MEMPAEDDNATYVLLYLFSPGRGRGMMVLHLSDLISKSKIKSMTLKFKDKYISHWKNKIKSTHKLTFYSSLKDINQKATSTCYKTMKLESN